MTKATTPPMPAYIAAMSGAQARRNLHLLIAMLRNPSLSPGEKVTLAIVLDEYERQGLTSGQWMTIDEDELSRLVGYGVDEDDIPQPIAAGGDR